MCAHMSTYLECIAQGGQRGNWFLWNSCHSNYFFNVILSLKVFSVKDVSVQSGCVVLWRPEEGVRYLWTEVTHHCKLQYGCWKSNSGSQKQFINFITNLSLYPLKWIFFFPLIILKLLIKVVSFISVIFILFHYSVFYAVPVLKSNVNKLKIIRCFPL